MADPMTAAALVEHQDRWVVSVDGVPVARCCIDYAVNVHCANGITLRIEQPFVLVDSEGRERLLVPEGNPAALAPVLGITRLVVEQCVAFKDGHLEMRFADGSLISVPATEDLEPWELSGDDGLRIVSVPGGDLAVWSPSAH